MKNLKYVIHTDEQSQKTRDLLNNSLFKEDILKKDVIYVYGNSLNNETYENKLGQTCINIISNFTEYNSILALAKLSIKDSHYLNYNYLLLDDNCRVLKGFKEKTTLKNILVNIYDLDIYWADKTKKHNIAIYSSYAILYIFEKFVNPLIYKQFNQDNILKTNELLKKQEIFKLKKKLKQFSAKEKIISPKEKSTIYSDKIERNITYFQSFNLIKYWI